MLEARGSSARGNSPSLLKNYVHSLRGNCYFLTLWNVRWLVRPLRSVMQPRDRWRRFRSSDSTIRSRLRPRALTYIVGVSLKGSWRGAAMTRIVQDAVSTNCATKATTTVQIYMLWFWFIFVMLSVLQISYLNKSLKRYCRNTPYLIRLIVQRKSRHCTSNVLITGILYLELKYSFWEPSACVAIRFNLSLLYSYVS